MDFSYFCFVGFYLIKINPQQIYTFFLKKKKKNARKCKIESKKSKI